MHISLLPGADHFSVEEIPAYLPSGSGEHLYVLIEKRGLTTDEAASRLARVCRVKDRDIGYAGRKDRHAVTTQWMSAHFGKEEGLGSIAEGLPAETSLKVLQVARHSNKIRLGHLKGNRFILTLSGITDQNRSVLQDGLKTLENLGIPNAFGVQRFGFGGGGLQAATAWANGDFDGAVSWIVDPSGQWKFGQDLPDRFVSGPGGKVVGALRRGRSPLQALHAAGDNLQTWHASVAQSAIFNAVLKNRTQAGLLYDLRAGDIGMAPNGAPFVVAAADVEDCRRRVAPALKELFTTGPLPGSSRLQPAAEILAQEQAWSAETGIPWSAFAVGAPLESHGERRALIIPFLETPNLDGSRLSFALGSGSYATVVLEALGVTVPNERAANRQ
jgi:tRNA pseudouridine13 synthase